MQRFRLRVYKPSSYKACLSVGSRDDVVEMNARKHLAGAAAITACGRAGLWNLGLCLLEELRKHVVKLLCTYLDASAWLLALCPGPISTVVSVSLSLAILNYPKLPCADDHASSLWVLAF